MRKVKHDAHTAPAVADIFGQVLLCRNADVATQASQPENGRAGCGRAPVGPLVASRQPRMLTALCCGCSAGNPASAVHCHTGARLSMLAHARRQRMRNRASASLPRQRRSAQPHARACAQVCRLTDRFDCVVPTGDKWGRRGNISGGFLEEKRSKIGTHRALAEAKKQVGARACIRLCMLGRAPACAGVYVCVCGGGGARGRCTAWEVCILRRWGLEGLQVVTRSQSVSARRGPCGAAPGRGCWAGPAVGPCGVHVHVHRTDRHTACLLVLAAPTPRCPSSPDPALPCPAPPRPTPPRPLRALPAAALRPSARR